MSRRADEVQLMQIRLDGPAPRFMIYDVVLLLASLFFILLFSPAQFLIHLRCSKADKGERCDEEKSCEQRAARDTIKSFYY